jgi:hypothetical protein
MWGVAFDLEDYSVVRNGSKVLDDQFSKRRSVVANPPNTAFHVIYPF